MARLDPLSDQPSLQTPAEIAARLEEDREALSRSIEGLRDRLTPDVLLADVKGFAMTNIGPYAQAVDRTVRANPLAAVLAGAAVAWLVFGRLGGTDADVDAAQDDKAEPESGGRTDGPASASPFLMDTTAPQDQAGRVEDWIEDTLKGPDEPDATPAQRHGRLIEDRPLFAAGIGMAIGAALGAALPRTAVEDRLLGPDRDQLLAQARAVLRADEDRAAQSGVTFATTVASGVAASLASSLVSTLATTLASKMNTAKDDEPKDSV